MPSRIYKYYSKRKITIQINWDIVIHIMDKLSLPSNGDAALPTSHPNIAEATGTCPMGYTASGVKADAAATAPVKPSVIPSSGVCPYGHGSK